MLRDPSGLPRAVRDVLLEPSELFSASVDELETEFFGQRLPRPRTPRNREVESQAGRLFGKPKR